MGFLKRAKSVQESIEAAITKGLIDNNLEPIKCECGSTAFYDKTRDAIDSTVCEKERFCKACNASVGYWAYGYWEPG
jgi:hypothetical protein